MSSTSSKIEYALVYVFTPGDSYPPPKVQTFFASNDQEAERIAHTKGYRRERYVLYRKIAALTI